MAFHNKPNFFIVGAPKCGTSALNHYLSAHPDIFVATKEMHFFGRDLRFGPQLQLYRKYPAEYWAEFDAWDGQARTGESSVWYLFSEQAAAEIKAFNPDARIIIMLREPTEMLYSLYSHFLADGNECLPTFEEALAAEPDRRAGRHHLTRQTYLAQALAYRATACFSEQVRRYFDVFGRERVHVILYDDFSAYTARVYRETLDFLGLAHDGVAPRFEVINGNVNGNCSVRSLAVRAILNDPLVRGGAITLRALLPGRFFKVVKKTGVRLSQFNYIRTPKKRQPMAPELQDLLRREFEPEVGRLSDLLGQDLSHWSKPNRFQQPDDRLRTVRESRPLLNQPEFETT